MRASITRGHCQLVQCLSTRWRASHRRRDTARTSGTRASTPAGPRRREYLQRRFRARSTLPAVDFEAVLLTFARELEAARIRYVIVGGLAQREQLGAHRRSPATETMKIWRRQSSLGDSAFENRRKRKRDRERRAFAQAGALHFDGTVVRLDEMANDRQTEAEAGRVMAMVAGLSEAFEYVADELGGDSLTHIADADERSTPAPAPVLQPFTRARGAEPS